MLLINYFHIKYIHLHLCIIDMETHNLHIHSLKDICYQYIYHNLNDWNIIHNLYCKAYIMLHPCKNLKHNLKLNILDKWNLDYYYNLNIYFYCMFHISHRIKFNIINSHHFHPYITQVYIRYIMCLNQVSHFYTKCKI